MITVITVLRGGGKYTPGGVRRLQSEVANHLGDHRFVCLTHLSVTSVETIEMSHRWPGWWAKMEMFRPGLFDGPALYLDIDTQITGDLSEIASYDGDFAMLEDFNQPARVQSGVMAFRPGTETERLWRLWIVDPEGHMGKFRGDGEWLHDHARDPDRLQDLFPGQIISWRNDCCRPNPGSPKWTFVGCPDNARVVCCHGRWKPEGIRL